MVRLEGRGFFLLLGVMVGLMMLNLTRYLRLKDGLLGFVVSLYVLSSLCGGSGSVVLQLEGAVSFGVDRGRLRSDLGVEFSSFFLHWVLITAKFNIIIVSYF